MEITRNGKTITLTDDEIEKAYRARRHYYNCEDIRSRLEHYIEDTDADDEEVWVSCFVSTTAGKIRQLMKDEKWISDCADYFDEKLSDNDSFMESFWMQADSCIEELIKEEE